MSRAQAERPPRLVRPAFAVLGDKGHTLICHYWQFQVELNQIRKIAQQAQYDLRSCCEDREILARFESVNEELTELTNEQGKIQADIKQMKIWMDGDRHESKVTAFASEAMRFTERADDYEAKIARLHEKLPALNARIDELSRQMNQIEIELLEL